MLNEDYKEMLQILLNNEVKFLIVGAYAMGVYGYPRATGDFDIWVEASAENSKKLYKSLSIFGAPLSDIAEKAFAEKGIIFQIGIAPRRIDIITHIDGVIFEEAYKTKELVEIESIKIPFISKENLIKNKQSTGREKDKIDINYLEKNKNT
ncbi:MAG: hypothetical protein HY919_06065 [Elusimicrobia bacterium]|nr:hypothetical protein [Elusimicrobiota bacterium]